MAAPTIPPRPSRSQNLNPSSANVDVPKIPPRPKRAIDRSISPHREAYARSPLNDPSFLHNGLKPRYKEEDVPARPPSVTLPSIGQEGSEYASLEDLGQDQSSPQQTKNVAGDLPLYAPTASVPSSTAKSRISAVTRTDSQQLSTAGDRKSQTLFPEERSGRPDSSRSESSATGRSRPQSLYKDDEEHGIPEIGVQVPMYPNAGDVQAPTPSPMPPPSSGIGFFNKGDQPTERRHARTKSGREVFHGPPGSYGRHGHGIIPANDFEKKWYERHPEDFKKEKQGEYGHAVPQNRKDYHWVGDDLVKLVHQTGSTGAGLGTSREAIGTPDEQIGYMASEEFAQRIASPRPGSARPPSIHKVETAPSVESPLRKMSFPADQLRPATEKAGQDHALESEAEDDVIHIDPPSRRASKVTGGGYDPPTEDLGPHGGNTEEEGGWINERGYGAPILASDEAARHPEAQYLQPAVSPELERHRGDSEYTVNDDGTPEYITGRRSSSSRPSSRNRNTRPTSNNLQRLASPTEYENRTSTPLDDVKEYEPLFPDDDHHEHKPKTAVDKLKRPDLARHHFPSQDVWEDAPDSFHLQTTVETPQVPEEPPTPGDVGPAKVFEKPEKEEERKNEITKEDQQSFLPERTKRFAKTGLNKDVLGDMTTRPGTQRFPSHDVWEDSPEHHHLVTTVSSPQVEDTSEYADEPANVDKQPQIPSRPARSTAKEISPVEKKAPVIPDRPKPQVPSRPAKPSSRVSGEKVPTTSTATETEAPQPKAKPQVPARPGGSKIAALKAGFLSDLNSKIGLGPQAPKVKEPEPEEKVEEERAPLQDARKGRAKGPQRRKPASSPSGAAATETPAATSKAQTLSIAGPNIVFEIGSDGKVDVPAPRMATQLKQAIGGVDLLNEPKEKETPVEEEDSGKLAVQPESSASVSGTSIDPEPISDATSNVNELNKQLSNDSADTSVQTGQQDIVINNPDGSKEEMTTYLGGRAQEEGSVVVKDGKEQAVGDAGERRLGVEAVSDGGLGANNAQREKAETEAD